MKLSMKLQVLCVIVPLAIVCTLTSHHRLLSYIPDEDSYVLAKNEYEETIIPKKELPIAEVNGIPHEYEVYKEALSRYYIPLEESWSCKECYELGLSEALPDYVGDEPMSNIGFSLVDINSDGADELFIGCINEECPVLLEMWAMVNDKPKLITQAEKSVRYYLRYDKGSMGYIIEACTGELGEEDAFFYYTFNGVYLDYLWDELPGVEDERPHYVEMDIVDDDFSVVMPGYIPYKNLVRV